MKFTKHARICSRQRDMGIEIISTIYNHGTTVKAKGGCVRKYIRRKDVEYIHQDEPGIFQLIDKTLDRYLVMTNDESKLITV